MFGCDLRSLGLLRAGLGLAVLADVLTRAPDLRLLYTDDGAVPRDLLLASEGGAVLLSAHYWASADAGLQMALFGVTAAAALALTLGWRTWLATLACWYLVSSLQIRQPLVYMGGDSMLRMLLFWALFVPLGGRFGLDARHRRAPASANHVMSAGTVALLLQVCLMYWATGIRKTGPLWASGQAIFFALHEQWTTAFGRWLLDWPGMLVWLTHATLALELFGPFLAFVPLATAWFRMAAILTFWLFHVGLASTMYIGLFPVFSMVGWLAFLPARFWDMAGVPPTSSAPASHSAARLHARIGSAVAAVCLVYVVILLAERAARVRLIPSTIVQVGRALRLQQTWNMFAPDPKTRTSTYTFRKRWLDGSNVDTAATTSFRTSLYVDYAVSHDWDGKALGRSLPRFTALQCEGDPGLADVTLVQHSRRITEQGWQPLPERVIAYVRCEDVES